MNSLFEEDIMQHFFLFLYVSLLSKVSFAFISDQQFEQAYLKQQSVGQIYCRLPELFQGETKHILGESITTQFKLKDDNFKISAYKNYKGAVNIKLFNQQGVYIAGEYNRYRNIEFKFRRLNEISSNFVKKHNLQKIRCRIAMYYDEPIVIEKSKVHIGMHPHPEFDYTGYTKDAMESYFKDQSFQSFLILDNHTYYQSADVEEFLDKTAAHRRKKEHRSKPELYVPDHVKLSVASGGWGFYKFKTNKVEVIYTGGNMNHCIYNNTYYLIDGFLQYNTSGQLKVIYDLDGIVTQRRGRIGPRMRNRKGDLSGIILKDVFNEKPLLEKEFHQDFSTDLIQKRIGYRKNFFQKVSFSYKYKDKLIRREIKGNGSGKYSIEFSFINE